MRPLASPRRSKGSAGVQAAGRPLGRLPAAGEDHIADTKNIHWDWGDMSSLRQFAFGKCPRGPPRPRRPACRSAGSRRPVGYMGNWGRRMGRLGFEFPKAICLWEMPKGSAGVQAAGRGGDWGDWGRRLGRLGKQIGEIGEGEWEDWVRRLGRLWKKNWERIGRGIGRSVWCTSPRERKRQNFRLD